MNFRFKRLLTILALCVFALAAGGCRKDSETNVARNDSTTGSNSTTTPQSTPAPPLSDEQQKTQAADLPFTLPVLNAMFADETFAGDLKSKLGLTDEQIAQLKQIAQSSVANLKEGETNGSTVEAKQQADEKIRTALGEDKAQALAKFVSDRWANGSGEKPKVAMSNADQPNAVPIDTRIVVNAPEYRMDLFKDGKLVKSYKVGIGYPEFPLPAGMREASTIIFNPTWTPPDEPWVEGSKKVQVGKKVEAGSSLNPLGPIKIPIGLPSLIHGGKQAYKLGGFASHGCVGLTNPQVQNFSLDLAQLSGTNLTTEDVMNYAKNKTQTKNVKLAAPMPIELRYETIVVENGVLKIFRDVYERGTNTEANLQKVLNVYGVSLDALNAQDKVKVLTALKQMAVDAGGAQVTAESAAARAKEKKNSSKTVTRTIVGKKEIDIPLAPLAGKGYPESVNLNAGTMSNKPLNMSGTPPAANQPSRTNGNANSAPNANQTTPANTNSASKKF